MNTTKTAERLRKIMADKGIRQVDLLNLCKPYCEKFGVTMTKSHLSQYLSGKFSPKQDKLTVLSHALGVQEAWLMGYDVDMIKRSKVLNDEGYTIYEKKVIEQVRALNDEGIEKLNEYLEFLQMKYKKHDQSGMVQDA